MNQKVTVCYEVIFDSQSVKGSFDAKIYVDVIGKETELPKLIEFVTDTIKTGKIKVKEGE